MTEVRPCLLLLVPADWGAIPEGLAELRRYLADEYNASLVLRIASSPLRSPMPLYAGYWDAQALLYARADLPGLLERAFFTLNWLEFEDVG